MEYQIKISPRMLELLSKDLYSNVYFVLAELIANSYDADAENVYIDITNDEIRIEDDGVGMTPEQIQDNYLFVGKESKTSEENARTLIKNRIKMGRKGIGKLAALSVSNGFALISKANDNEDPVGIFVPKKIDKENEILQTLDGKMLNFVHVKEHGTAVVMPNPTIKIPALAETIVNNLGKIFPTGMEDFNIYLYFNGKEYLVEPSVDTILPRLATLIKIGNSRIKNHSQNSFEFCETIDAITKNVDVYNIHTNQMETIELKIEGWIGTYASTKGMKKEINEFSDNYLAVFANEKMGARNILDIVGKNRMVESYIVGNLYIDQFENPNFSDMASTNRQAYNENDPRWEEAKLLIRDLTDKVVKLHTKYTDKKKEVTKLKQQEQLKKKEENFKETYWKNKSKIVEDLKNGLSTVTKQSDINIVRIVDNAYHGMYELLGIKEQISAKKKKILISHTTNDKPFADIVYNMLKYNGASPKDIIYSSSEDIDANLPEKDIYGYLKEFFVKNIGNDIIKVFIVVSKNVLCIEPNKTGKLSWGVLMEMGASWIVKEDHQIFNIDDFVLQKPLNVVDKPVEAKSQVIDHEIKYSLSIGYINSFCRKIMEACASLGYSIKSFKDNVKYLKSMVILYDPSYVK